MRTNLYSTPDKKWIVTSTDDNKIRKFATIELASQYLEKIGVLDNEIDSALTEMLARGHTHVDFNEDGCFVASDSDTVRLNTWKAK